MRRSRPACIVWYEVVHGARHYASGQRAAVQRVHVPLARAWLRNSKRPRPPRPPNTDPAARSHKGGRAHLQRMLALLAHGRQVDRGRADQVVRRHHLCVIQLDLCGARRAARRYKVHQGTIQGRLRVGREAGACVRAETRIWCSAAPDACARARARACVPTSSVLSLMTGNEKVSFQTGLRPPSTCVLVRDRWPPQRRTQ